MQVAGRRRAQQILCDAGKKFVKDFMAKHENAVALRSKSPAVCWKAAGQISYVSVSEFCGPSTTGDDAPLLYRIYLNMNPPKALFYHLNAPAVRCKLNVVGEPVIANEPTFELTVLPTEIELFGGWVTTWLNHLFYTRPYPPEPPVPVVSWGCGDNLEDRRDAYDTLGADWSYHTYLWTTGAIEVYEPWLKN